MLKIRQSIRPFIVLAAAALLLGAKSSGPQVGQMAPNFELALFDGGKVKLQDLRGQVVILNFWATWCVPCRTELPLLDRYTQLRAKDGLKVYAVTTEDSVPPYMLKKLFSVLHLSPVKRMRGPYAYTAVPTNYVIDRAGRLRYVEAGAMTLDTLNREVGTLLAEPIPPQ